MEGRPVRLWSAVGLVIGLVVVLIFNESPIELLRLAQALAVVAFPVLGLLVLTLSRDRDIMGPYAHKAGVHAMAILGYVAILGIVLAYIVQIVGWV